MANNNQDVADYIRQAAIARGIDPNVALGVYQGEGASGYVGDNGTSFGPFQLHYGGGLGDLFTERTGLHASNPATWQAQVDFALDQAKAGGWGPWHGWKGPAWAGINRGGPVANNDFLTDYPVAAPTGQAPTAVPTGQPGPAAAMAAGQAAPTTRLVVHPENAVPDFERDFAVAPEGASAPAQSATTTPSAQAAPPIGVNDLVRATATGVPILGGVLNRADAATNAFLAPYLNPLFDKADQLQGATYAERYANALRAQEGMDTTFAAQHPIASTAANVGGSVAGTIPAMMAAPELFGIGGGGLATNVLMSGGTGAAINAADTAVRQGLDLPAIERSAMIGDAFGAGAPVAGKIVGSALGKITNALSSTTPAARNVANILSDIGMTPQQAENALARMGPDATLADLDPALTTEAGGLASMGGKPTSILKNAMRDRAANVDNRVSDLMDRQLGPAPDAEATLQGIQEDASKRAAPYYDAGRNGAPMDVTPVLANIDAQLPNASGGIKNLLDSVRGFLTNPVASKTNPVGLIVPKSDPGAILGARQALDDIMYNRQTGEAKLGPNAMRVAGDLRAQIDGIIKSNPDFAQGDAIYSQAKNVQSAFKQGQEIFSSNIRPVDLSRMIQGMSAEEQAALRDGARASIADVLASSRRGEGPAAQGLFGRSTNNRANFNMLFPNATETLDALHSQAMMRGSEQRIAQNSATAERQAVHQKYEPKGDHPMDVAVPLLGEAVGGGAGAAAATIGKLLYGGARNALSSKALDALTEGTARGLAAQGAERTAFLRQVARAGRTNTVNNALTHGGEFAANLLTRTAPSLFNDKMRAISIHPIAQ